MDFIDVKYINLLSSRLPKFKRVKAHLYNFRCPICGDSQKSKSKARGYLYRIKNNTNFKCHNCGLNISFNSFLKQLDPVLHKEYIFEKFKGGQTGKNFVTETPESVLDIAKESKPQFEKKLTIDLPSAFDVNVSKIYLHGRAIFDGEFYYCENFKKFANSIRPGTFENEDYGEPRVVIPMRKDGNLIGVQGRALSSNPIKYITVMIDDEQPKIYGLDRIDADLPVYVVEGPLDSTFVDNCVALCGSDGDVGCLEGSNLVFVYDNEPRNKEIVKRIERHIEQGNKVVIWPKNVHEKDINDMVLAGHYVKDLIKSNTYQNLEAKLHFTTWKRV
jgi:transcription elongation factor Elf1